MNRNRFGWLLAAILLGAAWALEAADLPGQFIVELAGEPAVAAAGSAKSPRMAASRAAVRSAQARVRSAIEARGARVVAGVDTVLNALVVEGADRDALAATPGVTHVYPVRLYKKLMDRALDLQKVTSAWPLVGGPENAGAGMKIGIIDSGIDSSHPAFRDSDFSLPSGFPIVNKDLDTRYTNNKVIVARNYDRSASANAADRDGHGTAVAMVAAGVRNTAPLATLTGIAPKAWLGSYKVFPDGEDGAPNSSILKAIDDAVADGMDVINLSLGSFPAERLDADPIAMAIDNASRAGVVVVVASGNDGPGLATVSSPATAPTAITVGASVNDRQFASTVSLDGSSHYLAVPGTGPRPSEPIRGQLYDISQDDPTGLGCDSLPSRSLQGKIALILRGTCFFEDKLNNAQRAGAIAAVVYTHSESPEASTMSVGAARLPAVMISNADGLATRDRLKSDASLQIVLDFSLRALWVNPDRLAEFTSKGPSVDAHVKPDLLAIGSFVYTAQPNGGMASSMGRAFRRPWSLALRRS